MTKGLIIVPFDPAHIRMIEFDRPEMEVMKHLGDLQEYAKTLASCGPAFSLFDKHGLIIGSAGIGKVVFWDGVGEAWALISSLADQYMFSIHAVVKRSIDVVSADMKLHRLQTLVPFGSRRAKHWAKHLGFKREGPMYKWGPNRENYYRYARIF